MYFYIDYGIIMCDYEKKGKVYVYWLYYYDIIYYVYD